MFGWKAKINRQYFASHYSAKSPTDDLICIKVSRKTAAVQEYERRKRSIPLWRIKPGRYSPNRTRNHKLFDVRYRRYFVSPRNYRPGTLICGAHLRQQDM